ncbi:armadillo-type protein [Lophiotrema nucula]|uniref:Armadillo-type protein n=1 Tax=Lophiotrema nucula TaxID=690887 RepID=A0A6A5YYH8_9PLEO|nr:armadillo-type protein [Lophiotrema nucula]
MSYFNSLPEELLHSLEDYLRQGPQAQSPELKEVPTRLKDLYARGEIGICERSVEVLGTAVGKQDQWQSVYLENGILEYAVNQLDLSKTPLNLVKQCLRVIGNCVADNDINRECIVEYLETIIWCLEEPKLVVTTLAVVFNLCNDYGPAQAEAARIRLDNTVAKRLIQNTIPEGAIDYAAELLAWTVEKLTPAQLKDNVSLTTLERLIELSMKQEEHEDDEDEDHYQQFEALCAHLLQDPELHQKAGATEIPETLFDLILDLESKLSGSELLDILTALSTQRDPETPLTENTTSIVLVQLINAQCSISASDAFLEQYTLRTMFVEKVRSELMKDGFRPSTVCVCVILGNLATSDEACIKMVQEMSIHKKLIDILANSEVPALSYAAAGCIRHLTFPEQNRNTLAEAGLINVCCRLLEKNDPSTRGEAAAILAKSVANNMENIKRVIYEKAAASDNEFSATNDASINSTILNHIVTQALAPSGALPSTSMKNPMIELGRTIVAILRYLRQDSPHEETATLTRDVFAVPHIARPVARLARQRFYAEARSEGLLGLGLLAQSPEGAACVIEELKADEGLLVALKEFVSEQKEGGRQGEMSLGRDRQNAIVLLHGLSKNGGVELEEALRDEVASIQVELSKLEI